MGIEKKLSDDNEETIEGVKIQEIRIPRNERELIKSFRNTRDSREFGVQLVMYSLNNQLDPYKIAKLCTPQEKQKIGYLCDLILSLQKYNVLRQKTITNLKSLSNSLQDSYENWVHVSAESDFVRKLMELELKRSPHQQLNYKWRVYPSIYAEDILDWLDLYHDEYFQSEEAKEEVDKFYEKRGILRLKL